MKKVELYFKNENDAYSAETELKKYQVKNVSIEKMGEGNSKGTFLPLFTSYGAGGGSVGSALPLSGNSSEEKAEQADPKYMSHMLRFEVEEKDYDEVIASLKDHDPYDIKTKE